MTAAEKHLATVRDWIPGNVEAVLWLEDLLDEIGHMLCPTCGYLRANCDGHPVQPLDDGRAEHADDMGGKPEREQ